MYLYSTSQGFFVRCFKFRITPELNQQLLIVSEADFYSISGNYKYSLALKSLNIMDYAEVNIGFLTNPCKRCIHC